MNLEQQVCSLDLAKRLKGLEVKQKSLFWHRVPREADPRDRLITDRPVENAAFYAVSAFTVAELGEMLHKAGDWECGKFYFQDGETEPEFLCKFRKSTKKVWRTMRGNTEADARAKMLIS